MLRLRKLESFCHDAIDGQIVRKLVSEHSHRLPSIAVTILNCEHCIREVSHELFTNRPATPPYVWMLLVFVKSMHIEHPEIPKNLLISATVRALEKTKFDPPRLCYRMRWFLVMSMFLHVYIKN